MSVVKLARRREEVAIAGSGVSEDSRLGAEMGEKEAVHKWFLSFLVVFRIFLGAHDPLPHVVSAWNESPASFSHACSLQEAALPWSIATSS